MLVAEWAFNDNNSIIGALNNTPEQNYPLANVYNKAIVTATELDAKFNLAPVSSGRRSPQPGSIPGDRSLTLLSCPADDFQQDVGRGEGHCDVEEQGVSLLDAVMIHPSGCKRGHQAGISAFQYHNV